MFFLTTFLATFFLREAFLAILGNFLLVFLAVFLGDFLFVFLAAFVEDFRVVFVLVFLEIFFLGVVFLPDFFVVFFKAVFLGDFLGESFLTAFVWKKFEVSDWRETNSRLNPFLLEGLFLEIVLEDFLILLEARFKGAIVVKIKLQIYSIIYSYSRKSVTC